MQFDERTTIKPRSDERKTREWTEQERGRFLRVLSIASFDNKEFNRLRDFVMADPELSKSVDIANYMDCRDRESIDCEHTALFARPAPL